MAVLENWSWRIASLGNEVTTKTTFLNSISSGDSKVIKTSTAPQCVPNCQHYFIDGDCGVIVSIACWTFYKCLLV